MSDSLPDTRDMTVSYCPGCEPELDPTRALVTTRYCTRHDPGLEGVDDAAVLPSYLSGGAEAGGDNNRAWCALFHRRKGGRRR